MFNNNLTIEKRQQLTDSVKKMRESNVDQKVCFRFLSVNNEEDREKFIDLRNEAIKRKNILAEAGEDLTDEDIDTLFLNNKANIINTLKTIGKNAILYSFAEKLDNVEEYFNTIGALNDSNENYEKLLQITNPVESKLYKTYTAEIQTLKEKLKETKTQEERKNCINQINTITKKRNDLVNNAIKDPKEKLEAAYVFAEICQTQNEYHVNAEVILQHMNPKTKEEKDAYYEMLNDMILAALEADEVTVQTQQRLSLKDSKYLTKLFQTDKEFKDNFAQIIELLNQNPDKTNLEIFNELPENIETKALFKKQGLNYNNWVKVNPGSKIGITVRTDLEKQRQSAIKNLEADFNDDIFKKLPKVEIEKLKKALKKEGLQLVEKDEAIYEGDGFLNGSKKVLRLYKNNNPVEFEDLHKIIKLIKEEINTNEFWNKKSDDIAIDNARETIKNHILKLRYNEVKTALNKKADKDINLVVQKADMNDITHALFLGNDAACCTAVGTGCNEWSAPNYIKNKLISAIEVKDGETYAGNTMMYVINVDGKPALLLDNIELKPKYQFNDKIRDAIFDYAKIVAKEIGIPDMQIYAGPNRHKVNMDNYELKEKIFAIVGSTGEDEIYLDFDTDSHIIDNPNYLDHAKLYRIR